MSGVTWYFTLSFFWWIYVCVIGTLFLHETLQDRKIRKRHFHDLEYWDCWVGGNSIISYSPQWKFPSRRGWLFQLIVGFLVGCGSGGIGCLVELINLRFRTIWSCRGLHWCRQSEWEVEEIIRKFWRGGVKSYMEPLW